MNDTGNGARPDWYTSEPSSLEVVVPHIERYWGAIARCWHEDISEYVHIDIHVVPGGSDRDFVTLISSGMSDRPMAAPPGAEDCRYAELMVALPVDWPMEQEDFREEANWWPFRMLKTIARMPHSQHMWIWAWHTVNMHEEIHAFSPFSGVLIAVPVLCPEEAVVLRAAEDKAVHFLSLIPLYREELQYARTRGTDALVDRLGCCDVTELVDLSRRNVCG